MEKLEKIIIATRNENKIVELKPLLRNYFHKISSLNEIDRDLDIIEDGRTFYDNAYKKAKAVFDITKTPSMADDSGLCIPSLDYKPGVFSARYSGPDASDETNNSKLLKELQGIKTRDAFFECCIVLFLSEDKIISASGRVNGRIIDTPRGNNGFGYDPIFYMDEYKKTMAELPLNIKNQISHRAIAMRNLIENL